MRIEFGDIQSTVNSLNDKVKASANTFDGYIAGSQVMLRARKMRYPSQAAQIDALLRPKDVDLRFEPHAQVTYDQIPFRIMCEEIMKSLFKKKTENEISQLLPNKLQHYYSLPADGAKGGLENNIDVSVQNTKIKPCMNIDVKADFNGEIQYVNAKNQKDFEITYLEKNLIMFYDMETMDFETYPSRNKMAFMLKKCLKPEVKDFGTLLAPDTAFFVQDLFENPAKKPAKDRILGMMFKHYKIDVHETEAGIKLLYSQSLLAHQSIINDEMKTISWNISKVSSVAQTMLDEMKPDDEISKLERELNELMSSSSKQTLEQSKEQLNKLENFRNRVVIIYDKHVQELNKQQLLSLSPIAKAVEKNSVTETPKEIIKSKKDIKKKTSNKNQSNNANSKVEDLDRLSEGKTLSRPQSELPKKNKKTSPVLASKKSDTNLANLDLILKEAKKDFGKNPALPISLEDEYKKIIKRHEAILNSVKIMCAAPEDASEKSKGEIVYYATIIETFQRAESNQALANLCYDLIGFYSAKTKSIMTDNNISAFDANVDKKVVQELMRPFDALKKLHTSSDSILKCMHILMMSLPFNSLTRIDSLRLHAAMKHVQNYRGSPDLNIDILLKNIFILVKDQPANPVLNATTLLVEAISADMAERLQNGKKNDKTLSTIKVLLRLEQKVATLLHCTEPGDYLDKEFSESIFKSFLKQGNKKDEMTELFTHCFVHSMIEAIIMGANERADDFMLRHVIQARVMIESYIFSANGKVRNGVLGELVKNELESMTSIIRNIYYILSASVPQLGFTPHEPYRFSNVGHHLNRNTISSELALVSSIIRSIRDRYGEFLNPYHRLQYDAVQASLAGLIASPYGIFHENHSESYSNTLQQSARFRLISSELVTIKNATGGVDVNEIHYDATKNPIVQGYVKSLGEAMNLVSTPQPIGPVHHDQSVAGIAISDGSKAKKLKKVAGSSSSQIKDDFDKLLEEAKNEISKYPASKQTIEDKYKALINKHQMALSIPLNPIVVPTNANAGSILELIHYSTIQEFVSEAISKCELAQLFFELNDFYRIAINDMRNDALASDGLSELTEKHYNEIFTKINTLKTFLKSKHSILRSMHEIMVATYLNPDDIALKNLSEKEQGIHLKVLDCLNVHSSSDDHDIECLLKNVFDIIEPNADDAIEKCVSLILCGTRVGIKQILISGEQNINTLSSIKVLIGLKTLSSMFMHFKRKGDMLEYTFVQSITKVLIEQTSMKNRVYELFTHYFINQTIATLTEKHGLGDPDHFNVMTTQAGIMIVKHLFPSDAFSENAVLVSHVLTYFSSLNNRLKAHYSILIMATPSITVEKHPLFILNSPASKSLSECAQQFSESRGATAPQEIKGIINLTIIETRKTRKIRDQYKASSLDHVALSFDITLLALEILKEHSNVMLGANFKEEFTKALSFHTEFMSKVASLSAYKMRANAKKSKVHTIESEFYIRSIMAMTDSGIHNVPTKERVNHLYNNQQQKGPSPAPQTTNKCQPTPK